MCVCVCVRVCVRKRERESERERERGRACVFSVCSNARILFQSAKNRVEKFGQFSIQVIENALKNYERRSEDKKRRRDKRKIPK